MKVIASSLGLPGFLQLLHRMFRHYPLHVPEHVGAYAGSLLPRSDWDHS